MLSKLFKYEVKATSRYFLPMYLAIVIFTLINKLFLLVGYDNNMLGFVSGISLFLYVFIIIATFILAYFVSVYRFYKNLLTDEGYLMFTLPVKVKDHIAAKLLSSFMWLVISAVITLASVFALIVNKELLTNLPGFLKQIIQIATTETGMSFVAIVIESIAILVTYLIASLLMIYLSISIGQLIGRHKILGSFGAYLVLYTANQIINMILIIVAGAAANNLDNMFFGGEFSVKTIQILMLGVILINVILSVIYYVASNVVLSRKLNLD